MGDQAPPPNQRDEQTLFLKVTACLPEVRTVCLASTGWVLTIFLLVYGVYDWKNSEVYDCNNRERTLQKEMSELHRNWTECETISQENAALSEQYSTASWTIRDMQADCKLKTQSIDRLTSDVRFCTLERGESMSKLGELEDENEELEVKNQELRRKLECYEGDTANLRTSIEEKDNELDRMKEIVRAQGEQLSHTWETSLVVWLVMGSVVAGVLLCTISSFAFDAVSTKR